MHTSNYSGTAWHDKTNPAIQPKQYTFSLKIQGSFKPPFPRCQDRSWLLNDTEIHPPEELGFGSLLSGIGAACIKWLILLICAGLKKYPNRLLLQSCLLC